MADAVRERAAAASRGELLVAVLGAADVVLATAAAEAGGGGEGIHTTGAERGIWQAALIAPRCQYFAPIAASTPTAAAGVNAPTCA